MLNLSLKQAETALAKGQLDEAFSLLREKSARSTRQAQELAARLVTALIVRGNDHLASDRLTAAASDAAKAVELGGQQADVVELFDAVRQARSSQDKQQRHDQALLRQAKQEIDRGGASVGKQILDRANPNDTDVKRLTQHLDVRRELSEAALRRTRAAIDNGHNDKALDILIELLRTQPDHSEIPKEVAHVVAAVAITLEEDVRSGRLDRLSKWKQRLESVAVESTPAREQVDIIDRCHLASACLDQSSYAEAERELGLLGQMIPGAGWIGEARATLRDLISAANQLGSGPLGLITGSDGRQPPRHRPFNSTTLFRPDAHERQGRRELPTSSSRLLLQIDGVGSVLLLRSDSIRIGSASRTDGVDISLMSDGIGDPVEIRRQGGDYLLTSATPLEINDRKVNSRLLTDGDVFSVGRRGRIRFNKPVAASSTAMLEMTGAPMQRAEIRRVALFADSLIIGKGPHSQVVIREAADRYVLYQSDEQFAIRSMTPRSGPAKDTGSVPIAVGKSVVLDDLRLRITPYETSQSADHLSSIRGRQLS